MMSQDRTNLLWWRWQRRSALLLIPLLAFHVIYQYFVISMDGISFDSVSDQLNAAVYLGIDILLLITVTVHAFTGMQSVIVDYAGSAGAVRWATGLLGLLCVATVAYGVAALFAFL